MLMVYQGRSREHQNEKPQLCHPCRLPTEGQALRRKKESPKKFVLGVVLFCFVWGVFVGCFFFLPSTGSSLLKGESDGDLGFCCYDKNTETKNNLGRKGFILAYK